MRIIAILFTLLYSLSACAEDKTVLDKGLDLPPPMSAVQFDELLSQISNWGRWGKEDQLGTLNLVTNEKRINAAGLVKTGQAVSLSLPLNKVKDLVNESPFVHEPFIFPAAFGIPEEALPQAAGDNFAVAYHGFAHSHLDAVSHFAYQDKMYNGYSFEMDAGGFANLGIENIAEAGIVTRGVLVDMPAFLGLDYLAPGTAITIGDLLAWEKKSGVSIGSGDALLIRTGRWKAVEALGQWHFVEKAAGLHASVAAFLKERDVAVIGCDGVSDVMPSGVENRFNPVHELVLIGLGMPLLDNLDLRAVSKLSADTGRATFMLVASPLKVNGATGSPLNPIAVF
ncbi:MAG: cyclase family protein [Pseudomonadales bacterium]|nr:cyclase family protein [Pseudomonadales bacterium]